jgi:hypothetical protein
VLVKQSAMVSVSLKATRLAMVKVLLKAMVKVLLLAMVKLMVMQLAMVKATAKL